MDYTVMVEVHGRSAKNKATIRPAGENGHRYSPYVEPWVNGILDIRAKNDDEAWMYVEHLVIQKDTRPIAGRSYLRQCRVL